MSNYEYIIDIAVLPHAFINPNGDCGACCLASVSNKSVREVYDFCFGGMRDGFDYDAVVSAIEKLGITYINALPKNGLLPDVRWKQFLEPSWFNWINWFDNASEKIKEGYVGVAMVVMNGTAPEQEHCDHWVLIKGVKKVGENAVDKSVVISCPTKGELIMQPKDFLKKYGGYNAIWCKVNNVHFKQIAHA